MPLSCYVPSQIIPKSRIVHLADKQILKTHIMSYPKIIVSKNPPPPPPLRTGGGGRVSIPGPWTTMSVAPLLTNNLDNSKQKTSNLLSPAPPPYSWALLGKCEGPAPPPSSKISWYRLEPCWDGQKFTGHFIRHLGHKYYQNHPNRVIRSE